MPDLAAAQLVLRRYGLEKATLVPLGNHGGFSGARLWRVEAPAGPLCVRAWPSGDPTPERLSWIHQLMETAGSAGLAYIPVLGRAESGKTWIEHQGRLWDLCRWMPGRADFRDHPSASRIEAACTALALLHASWSTTAPTTGICPAIQRRLHAHREWVDWSREHDRLPDLRDIAPAIADQTQRAWQILQTRMDDVSRLLAPWLDCQLTLQPCLCDIWHDHVLYQGEAVSGIIDYGGAKIDHVAVDLARLLGSTARNDASLRRAGIDAYRNLRPLALEEVRLVSVLDETGILIGLATWLKWLYRDGRKFENTGAVVARLTELLKRLTSQEH
jgi:homoserine kinase type II